MTFINKKGELYSIMAVNPMSSWKKLNQILFFLLLFWNCSTYFRQMSIYVLLFVTWGHYLNLVSWITVFNRVHFELFKWLSSRLVKDQWWFQFRNYKPFINLDPSWYVFFFDYVPYVGHGKYSCFTIRIIKPSERSRK